MSALNRRAFLTACTQAGVVSSLLPGILLAMAAQAEGGGRPPQPIELAKITSEMLDRAAELAGVGAFSAEQKTMMLAGLNDQRAGFAAVRSFHLASNVPPAFVFHPQAAAQTVAQAAAQAAANAAVNVAANSGPLPPGPLPPGPLPPGIDGRAELEPILVEGGPFSIPNRPETLEGLAFASVQQLGALLRAKQITSLELTRMYLARLKRFDPQLHCVITLLEERALKQAQRADEEIAAGRIRGPLHGIAWGAKDLLAVKGAPTTWGAGGFEQQHFDADATVVERLDEAGAVLVAKLSLGALAMGDKWFGGRTRNPWNLAQGSSGSSAGSACAVAAGCVAFALGSETLGSISSPSTRCGVTGLRPTFGLVPRTGAMALSWTMDKLGPIARSAADCRTVLEAIAGPDGHDTSVVPGLADVMSHFGDWKKLRVGYLKSEFDPLARLALETEQENEAEFGRKLREARNREAHRARSRREYDRHYEQEALKKLRSMGVELIPVELPKLPWSAMVPLLTAEAAAAFDELTTNGRDRLLTEQGVEDWPNAFRIARLYPAVEYIQANRLRTVAILAMNRLFAQVDVIVTPTTDAQLTATNLTGHPALIVPNGLRGADAPAAAEVDDGDHDDIGGPGTPVSLTFLAGLGQEAKLLALGAAYQHETGFQQLHPPSFRG